MIVRRSRYGAFAGEWEDYCEKTYAGDPTAIAKCSNKNITGCVAGICPPFLAPWTIAGKAARGMASADVVAPPPIDGGGPAASEEGIFGLPKWVAIGGVGLLAVGGFALAFSRRKKR